MSLTKNVSTIFVVLFSDILSVGVFMVAMPKSIKIYADKSLTYIVSQWNIKVRCQSFFNYYLYIVVYLNEILRNVHAHDD